MTKSKQRGFTIIEVALVLAVAALIFLVVFLAVPALQRNQRDDARKRDVADVVQAVTNSVANRNKELAAGTAYNGKALKSNGTGTEGVDKDTVTGLGDYLDSMSGNVDYIKVVAATSAVTFNVAQQPNSEGAVAGNAPRTDKIIVYPGYKCADGGNTALATAAKRSAAVVVQVENGGDGKYYCQNAN